MNCEKSGLGPSRADTLIQLCFPFKPLPGRENVSKTVSRLSEFYSGDIKFYKWTTCISPRTAKEPKTPGYTVNPTTLLSAGTELRRPLWGPLRKGYGETVPTVSTHRRHERGLQLQGNHL